MTRDEQARQRLVEHAIAVAEEWAKVLRPTAMDELRVGYRVRAGFRVPSKGSWCAAGLTAAMDKAGLLVPAPGTPARRGAIALLDFVWDTGMWVWSERLQPPQSVSEGLAKARPGDIIAWKQHPRGEWRRRLGDDVRHAFSYSENDYRKSLCGEVNYLDTHAAGPGKSCSSCSWETRKGHVAVIVSVDDESLTTVGWNEGAAPGRVMMRRLWRDEFHACAPCNGDGFVGGPYAEAAQNECRKCRSTGHVPRSSTVLWRRPGGLRGIARPVAA